MHSRPDIGRCMHDAGDRHLGISVAAQMDDVCARPPVPVVRAALVRFGFGYAQLGFQTGPLVKYKSVHSIFADLFFEMNRLPDIERIEFPPYRTEFIFPTSYIAPLGGTAGDHARGTQGVRIRT